MKSTSLVKFAFKRRIQLVVSVLGLCAGVEHPNKLPFQGSL